jgi:hypothetical protein
MDFLPRSAEYGRAPPGPRRRARRAKDGGRLKKVLASSASPHPAPHAEQSPLCPSAHGGWIGQACGIVAVRNCFVGTLTSGDPLAGLLPTVQAVVPGRRQPVGQDRKGLPARLTDSAPHPDVCAILIVALTKSLSVADDRIAAADRTSPRQEMQWDHPGSMLSFASGSAIKRIRAGVEARRLTIPCQSFDLRSGLHPPIKSVSNEKRILLCMGGREPLN